MEQQNVTPHLILASASPRRRELLQQAGIIFTVIPSNTSEAVQPGEPPQEYTLRVAGEKARDVGKNHKIGRAHV